MMVSFRLSAVGFNSHALYVENIHSVVGEAQGTRLCFEFPPSTAISVELPWLP